MELINATRMVAGYTMGMEPSGRELLVVVVKGTFRITGSREGLQLADEQLPLVMADSFTGAPGLSAPLYEVDYAPRKHRCDVLLTGSAYAPGGRPATRVQVGLRVNGMAKSFAVVGNRHWRTGPLGVSTSDPEPFLTMPISYDRAFGGVDDRHEDPRKHAAFMRNPVGRGYHTHLRSEWLDGASLPNTEESERPVTQPDSDRYHPMSFGPLGRHWHPRAQYAGTYDEEWLEQHFPFLPPDFDERYYQASPLDQQIPHPQGGAQVELRNLTPSGETSFAVPTLDAPVQFLAKRGQREERLLTLDTIVIEPDHSRFTLTWRAARPLQRNLFEIAQTVVGKPSGSWWAGKDSMAVPIRFMPRESALQREGDME